MSTGKSLLAGTILVAALAIGCERKDETTPTTPEPAPTTPTTPAPGGPVDQTLPPTTQPMQDQATQQQQ